MTRKSARRSVSKAKAGNVEARNASEISGLSLIDGGVFLCAVDKRQLFFERHLAEEFVDSSVAGDDRNGLRKRKGPGDCEECGRTECADA